MDRDAEIKVSYRIYPDTQVFLWRKNGKPNLSLPCNPTPLRFAPYGDASRGTESGTRDPVKPRLAASPLCYEMLRDARGTNGWTNGQAQSSWVNDWMDDPVKSSLMNDLARLAGRPMLRQEPPLRE